MPSRSIHLSQMASADRLLGCFRVFANVNNAIMNMWVWKTLSHHDLVSFGKLKSGTDGSYGGGSFIH